MASELQKYDLDRLDYKILETLLDDGRITYKDLAKKTDTDERLISRRVEKMVEKGIVKFTADIDWSKLGFHTAAYIGTRTGIGEALRQRLFDVFKNEPRIVKVDSTVGANEYVVRVIAMDIRDFRSNISIPLEPVTSGISTSIISEVVKKEDYKALLRLAQDKNIRKKELE